jgi:hypothetical protein
MTDKLNKRCLLYEETELRPPPHYLVIRWGRQLGLTSAESSAISDGLTLRHRIG